MKEAKISYPGIIDPAIKNTDLEDRTSMPRATSNTPSVKPQPPLNHTNRQSHDDKALDIPELIAILAASTQTPMGTAHAKAGYRACSPEQASLWLSQTNVFVQLATDAKNLPIPHLDNFEISPLLRRAKKTGHVLEALELRRCAHNIQKGNALLKWLQSHPSEVISPIKKLIEGVRLPNKVIHTILKSTTEDGDIHDDASPKLAQARHDARISQRLIHEHLEMLIRSPSIQPSLQESTIVMRENRRALPIRASAQSTVKGIILAHSRSSETVFIEPQSVVVHNNNYQDCLARIRTESYNVLRTLTEALLQHFFPLMKSLIIFGMLDFVMARAKMAQQQDAVLPQIKNDNTHPFFFPQARHPLLGAHAVPLDLSLGHGSWKNLVITGPNTGGKTVALKTFGMLVEMACRGMFIPCKEGASLPWVDKVLVDIGDRQSISSDMSTFSSHILNICSCLSHLTQKSLLLLDELGTGTDPDEGAALGIALLDACSQKNCWTIVTTHLKEIRRFATYNENYEIAACVFDEKQQKPTYNINYGYAGRAYALNVARNIGLPHNIINKAKKILNDFNGTLGIKEKKIEESFSRIKDQTRKLHEMKNRIYETKNKLETEKKLLLKEINNFEEEKIIWKKKEINKTRKKLLNLLNQKRQDNDQEHSENQIRKSLQELEKIKKTTIDDIKPPKTNLIENQDPDKITVGNYVNINNNLNNTGKVISIDKNKASIAFGSITITTPLDQISLQESPKTADDHHLLPYPPSPSHHLADPGPELKIIGMRGHEARTCLHRYIENSIAYGRENGTIIHGLGNGILRRITQELLQSYPEVMSCTNAKPDEGGSGATVFTIKASQQMP